MLCEVNNPSQFGIAEIKDNKIIKITEKPKTPPTNLAVTGIYFLTPYIFEIIKKLKPSWRNELEIADALQMLVEEEKEIMSKIKEDEKNATVIRFVLEDLRRIAEYSSDIAEVAIDENIHSIVSEE